nr:MAG TPA: hypothetical protein [Bacteriophage sp.]
MDREYRCFLTVCNIMHIRLVRIYVSGWTITLVVRNMG